MKQICLPKNTIGLADSALRAETAVLAGKRNAGEHSKQGVPTINLKIIVYE
jgi:hypothetical protein